MAAALSLIPELDDIVKNGTAERRAAAIERISDLFLQGAAHFETRHVALFDDILVGLVPATEIETRVELAERLSKLDNAPPTLVKQLAHENEIKIAGPILSRSPLLDDPTLIEIARAKGQEHLAAISGRPALSPSVTDVIVRRGDRDVVRHVAANTCFGRDLDPHQPVAHALQYRRGNRGHARADARLDHEARFGKQFGVNGNVGRIAHVQGQKCSYGYRSAAACGTGHQVIKKSGSRGAHSPTCAYENLSVAADIDVFGLCGKGFPRERTACGTRFKAARVPICRTGVGLAVKLPASGRQRGRISGICPQSDLSG